MWCFNWFHQKIDWFFFIIIGEKASTNIPLRKMYRVRKGATLTCLYGPMYLQLDDYPPYSDKISDIFETHINSNLRCIHGNTNYVRHTDLITWVSNSSWDMIFPARDWPFFYTRYHLSALQNCSLLLSTSFQFIFIFKECTTQFSHWIVSCTIFSSKILYRYLLNSRTVL